LVAGNGVQPFLLVCRQHLFQVLLV
jgi:hypothetical protein